MPALVLCTACSGSGDMKQPTSGAGGAGGSAATPSGGGTGGIAGQPVAGESGGAGGMIAPPEGSGGTGGSSSVPEDSCALGYSELSDGYGGLNVEQVCHPAGLFDRNVSLEAFKSTLYPLLRESCSPCHSTDTRGQAPIHADVDPALAHEYALTRVNFKQPADSKLVVRMAIDRHNCFGSDCREAAMMMQSAVQAWAAQVTPLLPETPRMVPQGESVSEAEVLQWIADDKATLAPADAEYIKHVSLHELHNAGVSADELNVARAAISKVLNSTARWAPEIVNPVDINAKGLVYRFDTRAYWGHNKGVQKLFFGGSDDDLFFGSNKTDAEGNPVDSSVLQQRYGFTDTASEDPAFAQMIWRRVLAGNVEGAVSSGTIPANIDGFKPEYIEASQLVYTLTRPDVYNAIMVIPFYATELEDELGVVRDNGMDSYQYVVTQQAITVDSRLYYRARTAGGFYWKTFDVFTGQEDEAQPDKKRFPFWANPIPKFISAFGGGGFGGDEPYSFIATLAQPLKTDIDGDAALTEQCDPQPNYGGADQYYNCRYYTGQDGLQQSAEESIWNLPNGLQGYALFGGFNQRRVDAFVNIVRDPRILRMTDDETINARPGFATPDLRLNEGGSCIGCHIDGLNRGTNDLRDWLEDGSLSHADAWLDDAATVARVRELYPPSSELRPIQEGDRRLFLAAMAKVRSGMVLGADPNVYVEPIVWTFEWAQRHYDYPATRSN
jgi:hypothetical protein